MYASSSVIYADVLFVINFATDFLSLFITSRILNCGGRTIRLVSGAVFGGLYAFVPYILPPMGVFTAVVHLAAAAVICLIAFRTSGFGRFLLTAMTFVASSALLGGLISAFFAMSSQYTDFNYAEMTPLGFLIICLISAAVALLYGLLAKRKVNTKSARVRLFQDGQSIDLSLLVDSGNLVTEPFSALPVIVVSSTALPPPYDTPESGSFPLPIRLIPFKTSAGGDCFYGFRPTEIYLLRLGGKPKRIDAYIGIDTKTKSFSGYDGLMPSGLI